MASEQEEPDPNPSAKRLSYKFQRLRERIRAAVDAGELVGKLPGERSLARQFNVNAKTLSKALTDLAAEGVLERNIGLGTFVRGGNDASPQQRVLLLADEDSKFAGLLRGFDVDVQPHSQFSELPPSQLAPFDVVVVESPDVPDAVVRDLIVRGKTVLTVDRSTAPYAAHAVVAHAERAAVGAARLLADLGHRRVILVDGSEPATADAILAALPHLLCRQAPAHQAAAAAGEGFTGAVCPCQATARQVLDDCRRSAVSVPDAFSVTAFGRLSGEPAVCGHYVHDVQICRTVADVLRLGLPHRPLTLWLAGEPARVGTTGPPPSPEPTDRPTVPA